MSITFDELLESVDLLTDQQAQQLKQRLDERIIVAKQENSQERLRMFQDVFAVFREGLSEQDLHEMIALMNEEFISLDNADNL
jgi:tRNA splicing endonuclease